MRPARRADRAAQRASAANPAPAQLDAEINWHCHVASPAPNRGRAPGEHHARCVDPASMASVEIASSRESPSTVLYGLSFILDFRQSYNRTRWCQFVRLASSEHVWRSGTIPTLNPRSRARSNSATRRPNPHPVHHPCVGACRLLCSHVQCEPRSMVLASGVCPHHHPLQGW